MIWVELQSQCQQVSVSSGAIQFNLMRNLISESAAGKRTLSIMKAFVIVHSFRFGATKTVKLDYKNFPYNLICF